MKGSLFAALAVVAGVGAAGCRGQPSEEPPIVPIRNMWDQPRYDAQSRSELFDDQRTMRPRVPGTIAREMEVDYELVTGRREGEDGWVLEIPQEMVRRHGGMQQLADRGQERFNIYCAPCHGKSGRGDGIVAQRAQELGAATMNPPTFHDDNIRHMPDGQLYATITNGIRNMPAYRHSIPLEDRWAIVGYVRALQISQAPATQARNDTVEGARPDTGPNSREAKQ